MMKLSQTKTNSTKGNLNKLTCQCKLSGTSLATSQAIALSVKNNRTAYISKQYIFHPVFDSTAFTLNTKVDLLTLVVLGATVINTTNKQKLTSSVQTNSLATELTEQSNSQPLYKVQYKNLLLLLNGNDAQAKKYFNLLKKHKQYITIEYYNSLTNNYNTIEPNQKAFYPPYLKKLNDFKHHLSYNPDTKTSVIKYW